VHESFQNEPAGPAKDRRRRVALNLPEGRALSQREIADLNPQIARDYAKISQRTLSRDLIELIRLELVRRDGEKYLSNISLIDAFKPQV
jgi:predicted DNA-binding protein (UPF0251 family)